MELEWLLQKSVAHASIDTFAKKLTLTDNKADLHRLKEVLVIFFSLLQGSGKSDLRYDTFIVSLLERLEDGFCMPGNINILS